MNKGNEIIFARFHENFEGLTYGLSKVNELKENGIAKIDIYRQNDELLKMHKWGTLLSSEDECLELIKIIHSKGKVLEELSEYDLTIGQGLNVSKDYIFDNTVINGCPFIKKALIPIMTNSDGAPFNLTKTENYLVNKLLLNKEELKHLRALGVQVFDLNSTSKSIPILILPRGIGRHFCAINSAKAFSGSYVEIYDNSNAIPEKMKLNLWLFLNSSVSWLLREISGRKNLGGGMLKAEAVDLKVFPLFYDFDDTERIKSIYKEIQKREALQTLNELYITEHKMIDDVVFNYLQVGNDFRNKIIEILSRRIIERSEVP